MAYKLVYTWEANRQFTELKKSKSKLVQFKAVVKALKLLSENPKHPGLNTHAYSSLVGPDGAKVWEAYAQNKTPAAYRIFFCYFRAKTNTVTIIAITPHP